MNKPESETATPVAPEDMFYGGSYWVWDVPGLGLRTATPGECATEIKRLRTAISAAEAEARRYAEFYPAHTDGRNTFVILADRIAELAEIKNDE